VTRLLTNEEIHRQLGEIDDWTLQSGVLVRTVTMARFASAIALVVAVADEAEQMDHHPDIDVRWRAVRFALSTHSAGGITQLDIELAHRIDAAVDEVNELHG
jgi:4a-hydroxytetrahydrobiopterin dehydratase